MSISYVQIFGTFSIAISLISTGNISPSVLLNMSFCWTLSIWVWEKYEVDGQIASFVFFLLHECYVYWISFLSEYFRDFCFCHLSAVCPAICVFTGNVCTC